MISKSQIVYEFSENPTNLIRWQLGSVLRELLPMFHNVPVFACLFKLLRILANSNF